MRHTLHEPTVRKTQISSWSLLKRALPEIALSRIRYPGATKSSGISSLGTRRRFFHTDSLYSCGGNEGNLQRVQLEPGDSHCLHRTGSNGKRKDDCITSIVNFYSKFAVKTFISIVIMLKAHWSESGSVTEPEPEPEPEPELEPGLSQSHSLSQRQSQSQSLSQRS